MLMNLNPIRLAAQFGIVACRVIKACAIPNTTSVQPQNTQNDASCMCNHFSKPSASGLFWNLHIQVEASFFWREQASSAAAAALGPNSPNKRRNIQ